MNRVVLNSIFAAGVLAVGFGFSLESADAAIIVSSAVGGAPTGVIYVNFDNLPLGNAGGTSGGVGVSYSPDGETAVGASSGRYAAPYISNGNGALFGTIDGPDETHYLTTGIGSVTLSLPDSEKYIGLLWGSVDDYNTLSLYSGGVGGTLVGTVTGDNVTISPTGDQGVNGTYYVNINSDDAFDTVVASSTQYAFEFDNVAFNPERIIHQDRVPEPASLAMFAVGVAGLGRLRRKKRPAI